MRHSKTFRSDSAPPGRWLRRYLISVLLALGVGMLPPAQAQALPFDICASGCRFSTIQAAINASPTGTTLRVAPGVYREAISLKAGVSLIGAGIEETILQGDGNQTVVAAIGAAIGRSTTLQNMTITGGGGGGPGGILVYRGASPTLRNLLVRNNVAQGPSAGGILVAGGSHPLLEQVEFRNNQASAGSALIVWEGRATVRNCTFVDNISQGPNGVIYGAVYIDEGSELTMENSTVRGNTGGSGGGLAVLGNSRATVSDSRFENNQARTQGGAIFVHNGSTLTLDRVVLNGNSSLLDGGAVTVSRATAAITHSTFTANSAHQDAGALNVILNSTFTLRDSVIENNRANRFAGGLTIQSGAQATVERNVVRNNLVTATDPNPLAGVGGGIKVIGAGTRATIRHNRIEGNTARDGGAAYIETQAFAALVANEILANRATQYGAGVVINDRASAEILDNVITGNRSDLDGGGVWIHNGSSARIERNLIANNQAARHGGGLTVFEDVGTTVLNNLITGNVAGQQGGGVRLVIASTVLAHNRIRNNRASDGGGVIIQATAARASELKINLVQGNSASKLGAGILISSARPQIAYNTIVENGRGQAGEGLHLAAGAAPTLIGNIVLGNDYGIRSSSGAPASTALNNVYGNALGNYRGVSPGATDLSVDPLFVNGFYLSQVAAGQSRTSPLVDASTLSAREAGLHTLTTRTDGVPDEGMADLGYHAPTPVRPIRNHPAVFIPLLALGRQAQ